MDQQAEQLNQVIKKYSPVAYDLLSKQGKKMYFPKMGVLSQSADAKNKKINATIGIALEESGAPMHLSCLSKNLSLEPNDIFPYASSYGKQELRESWKSLLYKKNPSLPKNISTPVVTQALTHALSVLGHIFCDSEDPIILTDRHWENYSLIFGAYNGKIQTFNTFKNNSLDLEAFENLLTQKIGKKILILNFPNNPTGYSPQEKEAFKIAEILTKRAQAGDKLLVICDDAYFGLSYEKEIYKESIFSLLANLHENILAVKVDGITKEDYAWGLRIGFITYGSKGMTEEVYNALEAKTAGSIRASISNASTLSQNLFLQALSSPEYEAEKKEKLEILKSRYETVKKIMDNKEYLKYFKFLPFNSGYFMCVELNKDFNAENIRKKLLEEFDTGVISMDNCLRIAYSSVKKADIPLLFKNIQQACQPKITIVGAGNVGSQAAFYSALKNLGKIILIDVVEGLAKGKALDISESLPIGKSESEIKGSEDYSLTKNSDIVVVTAGVARKPGMNRDDLININATIMKSIIPEIVRYSPNCTLIVVSNPLDIMVHLAYKLSGFQKNKVIGMAGVLDTARFKTFLRNELNVSSEKIDALVLGGHGDLMVPVIGSCKINGKPISDLLSQEKIQEIIQRVQNGGAEIVNLLKTGSAFFAPGLSIVEMIEAILEDSKKILPCSVMLNGEYGAKDVFAGVPVKLGKYGAEEIIEVELTKEEKELFKKSIEHIKKMTKHI